MPIFKKEGNQLVEYTQPSQITDKVDNITHGTCANLLNPTAQTRTINGVTFTNNGDGTYTVNGTASGGSPTFRLGRVDGKVGQKMTGCPHNAPSGTYLTYLPNNTWTSTSVDRGDGVIIQTVGTSDQIAMVVENGTTCNNLLFKPMLTTDLNAKYSDFVPYTGDSGRLNEDVSNKQDKTDNALTTTAKTVVGAIDEINSDLTDISTPLTISVTFGSSAFTNKVAFCYKVGKVIYYNIRFTTGSSSFPTTAECVLLNYPNNEMPVDQTSSSYTQSGYLLHGTTVNICMPVQTSDNRIGIRSGSTLQANENVFLFGTIVLK